MEAELFEGVHTNASAFYLAQMSTCACEHLMHMLSVFLRHVCITWPPGRTD